MIQCDICRDWMHGECVRLDEIQAADVDKYHCPKCTPLCGPSIMKKETNWHRHGRCGQVSLPQVPPAVWTQHHEEGDKLAQTRPMWTSITAPSAPRCVDPAS